LTWNRDQIHQPERPRCLGRPEADLDQIFRLMDLDGIPGEQSGEIADSEPPEAPRSQRPPERLIDRGPGTVHDVLDLVGRNPVQDQPIGSQAHIFGASPEQQVDGR